MTARMAYLLTLALTGLFAAWMLTWLQPAAQTPEAAGGIVRVLIIGHASWCWLGAIWLAQGSPRRGLPGALVGLTTTALPVYALLYLMGAYTWAALALILVMLLVVSGCATALALAVLKAFSSSGARRLITVTGQLAVPPLVWTLLTIGSTGWLWPQHV